MEPFHFDYYMLSVVRWEPVLDAKYPSAITFWIKVLGIPLHYWIEPIFKQIGEELGVYHAVDLVEGRIRVTIDGFKPLVFETELVFDEGIEIPVSLRYERLFGFCRRCNSLCHDEKRCGEDLSVVLCPEQKGNKPNDADAKMLSYKAAAKKSSESLSVGEKQDEVVRYRDRSGERYQKRVDQGRDHYEKKGPGYSRRMGKETMGNSQAKDQNRHYVRRYDSGFMQDARKSHRSEETVSKVGDKQGQISGAVTKHDLSKVMQFERHGFVKQKMNKQMVTKDLGSAKPVRKSLFQQTDEVMLEEDLHNMVVDTVADGIGAKLLEIESSKDIAGLDSKRREDTVGISASSLMVVGSPNEKGSTQVITQVHADLVADGFEQDTLSHEAEDGEWLTDGYERDAVFQELTEEEKIAALEYEAREYEKEDWEEEYEEEDDVDEEDLEPVLSSDQDALQLVQEVASDLEAGVMMHESLIPKQVTVRDAGDAGKKKKITKGTLSGVNFRKRNIHAQTPKKKIEPKNATRIGEGLYSQKTAGGEGNKGGTVPPTNDVQG